MKASDLIAQLSMLDPDTEIALQYCNENEYMNVHSDFEEEPVSLVLLDNNVVALVMDQQMAQLKHYMSTYNGKPALIVLAGKNV